jgi:hypothetical protein
VTTKLEPVVRGPDGRIVAGSLNAGGFTKEEKKAIRTLAMKCRGKKYRTAFLKAYLELLQEKNPAIVLDYRKSFVGESLDASLDVAAPSEDDAAAAAERLRLRAKSH